MGLFKRAATVPVDPDELRRWRGRSAEIDDAGALPWQLVIEALKTAPETEPMADADYRAWFMGALGLHLTEVNNRGAYHAYETRQTDIYWGQRYGRPVQINLGNQKKGDLGAMVTWVSAATPELTITASDGRLTIADTAPQQLVTFIRGLSEQPRLWKHVGVTCGNEGVVVKRPMKTMVHPQGWIYDLWLAEAIAHLASYTVLQAPDPLSTYLPYQLDRTHSW